MAVGLEPFYVKQYATNIDLLLQTKGSKIRGSVAEKVHKGKQASPVDQVGSVNANKVVSRFAPLVRTDVFLDRRWVFPIDYDLMQLVDTFDELRLITDPKSSFVQNAVYALGRSIDDEIIKGMFLDNKTGVEGDTTTAFLASQTVNKDVGGTASSLNVSKLKAARKILMQNEVDMDNEAVSVLVTAAEHDAMLNEIQVVSRDFNSVDRPVLEDGKVTRFLGMNFIHCERLRVGTNAVKVGDATTMYVPVYVSSGVHLGMWEDIMTDVTQRKDIQSLPWQAYVKGTFGGTRIEEKKIVRIEVAV